MGRPALDLTDQIYGHLRVVRRVASEGGAGVAARWSCMCDCGNPLPVVTNSHDLRTGNTSSCGCARHEPRPGAARVDTVDDLPNVRVPRGYALSVAETAAVLGISENEVRAIEERAFKKLRMSTEAQTLARLFAEERSSRRCDVYPASCCAGDEDSAGMSKTEAA